MPWLRFGLSLLAGMVVVYLLLTAPTHWVRIKYWLAHRGAPNTPAEFVDLELPTDSLSSAVGAALSQPRFYVQEPTPLSTVAVGDDADTPPVSVSQELALSDNMLVIPKIDVRTPVVWNSASEESIMLANLQRGVAHYGFTSLPNATSGNVFITGHSSYYWWDKGRYKTVFALLDQLTTGDQAFVQYEDAVFAYTVRETLVVSPAAVEVTDPTEQPTLTLMTCTPVGTSLRRLVIRFDLARVYPAEEQNAVAAPTAREPEAVTEHVPKPAPAAPRNRDVIELLPAL
ncbi:sortase [Candidatus Berkelbacteria bacterium]|nr:sortase [Candidatus Berkelbacteria bacterium]